MAASFYLGHVCVLNAVLSGRPVRGTRDRPQGAWAQAVPKAAPWLQGAQKRYEALLDRFDPILDKGYGTGASPMPTPEGMPFVSPFDKGMLTPHRGHIPHGSLNPTLSLDRILGRAAQAAAVTVWTLMPVLGALFGLSGLLHGSCAILGTAVGLAWLIQVSPHSGHVGCLAQEVTGVMALVTRTMLLIYALGREALQYLYAMGTRHMQADPPLR
jgi:hypothetical protein